MHHRAGLHRQAQGRICPARLKAIALSVDPVDSLQLTDNHKVAAPANWQDGDEVVIVPSLKDEEEIKKRFAKGYRAVKPYLRLAPQPNR